MARRKPDPGAIYVSPRLQASLEPMGRCALTTVTAPMGYGKTTAVNWFLAAQPPGSAIRVSIYSDSLPALWESGRRAFRAAGLTVLEGFDCPTDPAATGLLVDTLCRELRRPEPWYLFVDDLHLLPDPRMARFLCELAARLPENVHLIAASRDRILSGDQVLRLGGRLHRIGAEQLRLEGGELAAYVHRCGAALDQEQLAELQQATEGWMAAVYLRLRALTEQGADPGETDIYEMFTAAMLRPLPPRRQRFLAVMGQADEFTGDMARYITGQPDTPEILADLTAKNAFVTRLPGGGYRFHHMMKACAQRDFDALPPEEQAECRARYGRWYADRGDYLQALAAFGKCGRWDAALDVIQRDAGILLAALRPQQVLELLDCCGDRVLMEHPTALLVLMRRMFTWGQIPRMQQLKALLLESVRNHPDMTPRQRGNLLGECDLIESFLHYNDITEMSRLHRSASRQMTDQAVSIQSRGSWTFGSPSVLMMFHRTPGQLSRELAEMDDCMPHYYKITGGHGMGAQRIMEGEAALAQGRLNDAAIALERARADIRGSGQENMALCCDFLEMRLALAAGKAPETDLRRRREQLLGRHNAMWLHIFDSSSAWCLALLGQEESIPSLFREHRLDTVNFLGPCVPMMRMIENQVFLAQGAYARVIGGSDKLLALCRGMHYALVEIYVLTQTAAAYERLGKRREAAALVRQAADMARPDGLVLPFAACYRYLREVLPEAGDDFAARAARFGQSFQAGCQAVQIVRQRPETFAALTEREWAVAQRMARRLSNREIAGQLFLSEGTVKQYINQIYSKLHLTGDARAKRRRLEELMED